MTIKESLQNFKEQLNFEPKIENADELKPADRFIFVGMGGSALAPDLLKIAKPGLDILIHRDYGLPSLPERALKNSLIVINSYSGNTEEDIGAFHQAIEKDLNMAIVSTGGELIELAKKYSKPFIQMPNLSIEPRMALIINFTVVAKIMGQEELADKLIEAGESFDMTASENLGQELADKIGDNIPVIYASRKNGALAYIWKIMINETAKWPAFANSLPELNHNEIVALTADNFNKNILFINLEDNDDPEQIKKRFQTLKKLSDGRGFKTETLELKGSVMGKILYSYFTAAWVALRLAEKHGHDPNDSSLIEDFKKKIAQ